MTGILHDDELVIDAELVRRLVAASVPAYGDLPLRRLDASGSSNVLFRLGDDLVVRLPRQPGGGSSIGTERRWLRYVASHLAVPVPEIVVVGEPGFGYPEPWSVVRWLDGEVPAVPERDGAPRSGLAGDLADVVNALRGLDVPASAVSDPHLRGYRGRPLLEMDESTRGAIETSRAIPGLGLDLDACLAVWEEAMRLPGSDEVVTPRWLHADLLAENLLVAHGRLAGVLDFGNLTVGEPTADLAVAWDVLDPGARESFRHLVDVDDPTWLRGRAWALALGLMTFPYYWATMPARCRSRVAMCHAVLADAG